MVLPVSRRGGDDDDDVEGTTATNYDDILTRRETRNGCTICIHFEIIASTNTHACARSFFLFIVLYHMSILYSIIHLLKCVCECSGFPYCFMYTHHKIMSFSPMEYSLINIISFLFGLAPTKCLFD